ncbi:MAG: uncharacterized protein K0R49_1770 [Burkholderiales bacterium]|nr:uncharacterized protein [Burkholderiales bacterium]MCE3269516.1 uncharacterized protein [Burkholderiales bacterium]
MKRFFWPFISNLYLVFTTPVVFAKGLDCDTLIRNSGHNISDKTRQLLVVIPDHKLGTTYAKLAVCELINGGHWQIYNRFTAIIGDNGIAEPNSKVEGDNKTPSGLFYIGETFGYYPLALSKIAKIHMDYHYIVNNTDFDKFIDDSKSPENNYNSWVIGKTQAKRHENMWRRDNLYEYGAVLNYNMHPAVPGKGSAIFLHIWGKDKVSTAGCIALKKDNLIKVLNWLDKAKQPQILILN